MELNRTILLVEGESHVAMAEKASLEELGYEVIWADSGEKALETMAKTPGINLVLMDTHLGDGADGVAATVRILESHDLPVVFLSSHAEREIVEKTKAVASSGYVVKSTGPAVWDACIRTALKLFEARQALKKQESSPPFAMEKHLAHDIPSSRACGKPEEFVGTPPERVLSERDEDTLRESWIRPRESHRLLETVLDFTHVMVVLLDPRFNFVWVNRAYADTCRRDPSFFPGKNHFDLYPHEGNRAIFQRVVDAGEPCFVEAKPFEFPDQSERGTTYWDWSLIPVKDDAGAVTGLVFTLAEVTERVRAEEALRVSEERLRLAHKATNDVVWDWDIVNDTQRWNEAGTVVFGWTEIVRRPVDAAWWVDRVHPEDRQRVEDGFFVVVNDPGADFWRDEYRFRKIDGSYALVMDRGYVLRDEEGRAIRMIGAMLDITERERAREVIQRQLEEKEILLKEVHHRIKNNIASIGSMLRLHADATANDEARSVLQDAMGRVESMRIIYDKLLLSDTYTEMSVKTYLEDLISALKNMFSQKKSVVFRKEIDDFVLGVKALFPLGLVVNELVTNALKHAFPRKDSGSISVALSKRGREVVLCVEDDGSDLPETFDAEASCGFGLRLVSMLTRQLGGTFTMERDRGTKCIVEFEI